MARTLQTFLPLICFVVIAQGDYLDTIAGLRHLAQPNADPRNVDFNNAFNDWFHHFDTFPTSVHGRRPYLNMDPYFNRDPYFAGGLWDQMPQINNVFNLPSGGHNHPHQGHKESKPEQKPQPEHVDDVLNVQAPVEKPADIPVIDKPTDQEPTIKLEEVIKPDNDIKNQSEIVPPKTNKINENDDKSDKDDKSVELNEKKDYLLVGQGNNGNDMYLLHENPAPVVPPNYNQPANNVVYVPSSSGPSSSNQVYQILNGPSPTTNLQLSPEKLGVNNDVPISIPPTTNVSPATQPSNVVSVYSNGQIIQIPGVVVVPNNPQVNIGNQQQGPNYVVANVVPNNNVQSSNQNPGVYYAAVPNQVSNNPVYYVQVPNKGVNNAGNVVLNNGLPGNVVAYQLSPNVVTQPAASNGYVQSNLPNNNQGVMMVTVPNQGGNNQYQIVQMPQGSSNVYYNQPNQPSQGLNQVVMLNGQSMPVQTVQVQNNNNGNSYNQPITGERQEVSPLNQGSVINNQNVGIQTAVLMPSDGNVAGYYQPAITNQVQVQNVPSQGIETQSNGGSYIQPAVLYNAPNSQNVPSPPLVSVNNVQAPIQGNQVSNVIPDVATVNTADVVESPLENAPEAIATSPLILDGDNLDALGAQPAVMLTGFKDNEDGKKEEKAKEDKKDKKEGKERKEGKEKKEGKERKSGKERREKSKKRSRKDKEGKSGEVFTN